MSQREGNTTIDAVNVDVRIDRGRAPSGQVRATLVVTADGGLRQEVALAASVARSTDLRVTPVVLAFGATSSRATFAISNLGGSLLSWHAQAPQAWISVWPDTGSAAPGTAPAQVVVQVDPSRMPFGESAGCVDVVSSAGSASVVVTVSVPTPVILLNDRFFDFRSDLRTRELTIQNIGTGDLAWELASIPTWLSLTPSTGTTGQVSTAVILSVTREGLAAGRYEGRICLTSNAAAEPLIEITVRMQVMEQPLLHLSPDSLAFGPDQDDQAVEIANTGNGTLTCQIDAQDPWVVLDRTQCSVSSAERALVRVRVKRAGLTAGHYRSGIRVNSNGGSHVVLLAMEVPQAPRLALNRQTISLGASSVGDRLELRNTGTGRLTWRVSEDLPWGTVQPEQGSTLDEIDTLTVIVDRTGLADGVHTGTVTIASDGGEQFIFLECAVLPNRPPRANAGPDQSVAVGDVVLLDGSASRDPDGDALTYRWTGVPNASLSGANAARPTFIATAGGPYSFMLMVNDGKVESAPDTVVVVVDAGTEAARSLVVDLPGGANMEFVWIEPGAFRMGSPALEEGRDTTEGPQHQVTLTRGSWLGKYEVTQGQWTSVMGTEPWAGQGEVQPYNKNPAVCINWEDAGRFAAVLNADAGRVLYRLPTEAEWEYACRAGTSSPWSCGTGDVLLRDYAWFFSNAWWVGEQYAHPVGTKRANPWGLHDMHGNVWEWVWDSLGSYGSEPQTDPAGPANDPMRVRRGGSYHSDWQQTRSASRGSVGRGYSDPRTGFRLLRVEPGTGPTAGSDRP